MNSTTIRACSKAELETMRTDRRLSVAQRNLADHELTRRADLARMRLAKLQQHATANQTQHDPHPSNP